MSHVSVFRTKISNVNGQVLREAMQGLAQQLRAELFVRQGVKDIYVVVHGDYVLRLPNGRVIGVKVNDGQLQIVGDPYGWKSEFNQLSQKIVQTYVHFALLKQLQEMGYQLQNVQEIEGVITGEVVKV